MQTSVVYTVLAHSVQKIKEIGALIVCEQAAQILLRHKAIVLSFAGLDQYG